MTPPIDEYLDTLDFDEEVKVVMDLYDLPEEAARLHASIRRGLVDGHAEESIDGLPEPIPLRPGQARRQARFAAREQRKRRN